MRQEPYFGFVIDLYFVSFSDFDRLLVDVGSVGAGVSQKYFIFLFFDDAVFPT